MICNIQMWQGTIEVIVMPLTNGTRAGPEASVKAAIWGVAAEGGGQRSLESERKSRARAFTISHSEMEEQTL